VQRIDSIHQEGKCSRLIAKNVTMVAHKTGHSAAPAHRHGLQHGETLRREREKLVVNVSWLSATRAGALWHVLETSGKQAS